MQSFSPPQTVPRQTLFPYRCCVLHALRSSIHRSHSDLMKRLVRIACHGCTPMDVEVLIPSACRATRFLSILTVTIAPQLIQRRAPRPACCSSSSSSMQHSTIINPLHRLQRMEGPLPMSIFKVVGYRYSLHEQFLPRRRGARPAACGTPGDGC